MKRCLFFLAGLVALLPLHSFAVSATLQEFATFDDDQVTGVAVSRKGRRNLMWLRVVVNQLEGASIAM